MQEEEKKATDGVGESSPIVGHMKKFYQSENSRLYDEKR